MKDKSKKSKDKHSSKPDEPKGPNKQQRDDAPREQSDKHSAPLDAVPAAAATLLAQKKRRGKAKVDESQLTSEERVRRKAQKDLQRIAHELRTKGGIYKPQKYKRKVYKEGKEGGGKKKKKDKKEKKSKHDTPKWRPYGKVDVVILPIYWNMRHAEKDSVMKACARVEVILKEMGLTSHTDSANQYTPGQKMKYWETAGVPVRVELGPKDAEQGNCVIAIAGVPGTVAQKSTVNVDIQLRRELSKVLEQVKSGKEQQGTGEEAGESEDEAAEAGPSTAGSNKDGNKKQQQQDNSKKQQQQAKNDSEEDEEEDSPASSSGDEEEVEEEEEEDGQEPSGSGSDSDAGPGPASVHQRGQSHNKGGKGSSGSEGGSEDEEAGPSHQGTATVDVGGDDLEDDFEVDPEFMPEPEEEAAALSKKERLKKHAKMAKVAKRRRTLEAGGGGVDQVQGGLGAVKVGGQGQGGAKKKAKVVVF